MGIKIGLLHVTAKVEKAKPFELPTYSGVTRTYIVHSDLSCLYKGQTILLKLYKNITQPINPLYKNNLFLPFKDHTNGETTYGGGRYINLYETEIQNEKIIIDFNKCYNPWCAYSDGYNCPIPPKENHIEMEILAGEKNIKVHTKIGNLTILDPLGNSLKFSNTPQRIVCLVPSLTETLVDLGLASLLVGVTKFCIHPADIRATAKIIGGTKNPRIVDILALKPDLIIANKEENRKEDIQVLQHHIMVYVTDIKKYCRHYCFYKSDLFSFGSRFQIIGF